MKAKRTAVVVPQTSAALQVEPEAVQAFSDASAFQAAVIVLVKASEQVKNRWLDLARRAVATWPDMKQIDAVLALDSTATAIKRGMGDDAVTLLGQSRSVYSDAVKAAKDGAKKALEHSAPQAQQDVADAAVTDAEQRLKAYDSAKAAVSVYTSRIRQYCAALIEGPKKDERTQADRQTALGERIEGCAQTAHKLEGNFALLETTLTACADSLVHGKSLINALRRLVAMQDAATEADKKAA